VQERGTPGLNVIKIFGLSFLIQDAKEREDVCPKLRVLLSSIVLNFGRKEGGLNSEVKRLQCFQRSTKEISILYYVNYTERFLIMNSATEDIYASRFEATPIDALQHRSKQFIGKLRSVDRSGSLERTWPVLLDTLMDVSEFEVGLVRADETGHVCIDLDLVDIFVGAGKEFYRAHAPRPLEVGPQENINGTSVQRLFNRDTVIREIHVIESVGLEEVCNLCLIDIPVLVSEIKHRTTLVTKAQSVEGLDLIFHPDNPSQFVFRQASVQSLAASAEERL
jgi:hypothetical protein